MQYTTLQLSQFKQTPLVEKRPGEPDFSGFPWAGLIRILFWSYRANLPALRALALEAIERDARSWEGDR